MGPEGALRREFAVQPLAPREETDRRIDRYANNCRASSHKAWISSPAGSARARAAD